MRPISDRHRTVKWIGNRGIVKVVGLDNKYQYQVENVHSKCHNCGDITPILDTYHEDMDQKTMKKYVHRCTNPDIIQLDDIAVVKFNNFKLYCSQECKVADKL